MFSRRALLLSVWLLSLGIVVHPANGGERSEHFDKDPGWEGRNNRTTHQPAQTIRQDFGYARSNRAGGAAAGEIGGLVTPAAEPTYYARSIAPLTLNDALDASGVLRCEGAAHVLIGFFHADSLNEWRTPNTIVLRIQGRGDRFYAYVEYATQRWRAGGDHPRPFAQQRNPETDRAEPVGFPADARAHSWRLHYDPRANEGRGAITATIDGQTSICELSDGHNADGATFNRFGILGVMKSADSPGELWVDDVVVNGVAEHFDADPAWEGRDNRRQYVTTQIRPRFDFGFSPTSFAGGAPGELGGVLFRGDCRDAERLAAYGDRLETLRLDQPLRASGKVALRRAVSDSTTLLGFYNSEQSLRVHDSQASGFPEAFLGLAIEGPSRDGFFVYPVYRTLDGAQAYANGPDRPKIEPDGRSHEWSLIYEPGAERRAARITLTLDGKPCHVEMPLEDRRTGCSFDRFGIITTWIDGNGQTVFFDDLTYTATRDAQ